MPPCPASASHFHWKHRGRRQRGCAQEGSEVVFIGVIVEVKSLIHSRAPLLPSQVGPYTLPQEFTHSLIYLAPTENHVHSVGGDVETILTPILSVPHRFI